MLSGGGARGAYEVGVLRYIRERLKGDNRIDIITGSSIGAVNGAYIAATADRPLVFNQLCIACHALGGQGGMVGPALDGVGNRLTADYIQRWLRDPVSVKPDSKMPKLPLSEEIITELVAFLSKQTTASTPKEAGK